MKNTKRLHISMTYTFVGDTGIDIPMELLEGKTEEEQYDIAFAYAQNHIDEIPVADNAEYLSYSDDFEREDIDFDDFDNENKKLEEELKRSLFMNGVEAIEDFLGYEYDVEEDKDVTEARMDEVISQMPDEDFAVFYNKYCSDPVQEEEDEKEL